MQEGFAGRLALYSEKEAEERGLDQGTFHQTKKKTLKFKVFFKGGAPRGNLTALYRKLL